MEKMKYDMAGGAAMIGAMRAIALLKPKVKVIGIVCATENMPSGKAQKPGDVQIAMSGKSIEIINTDAEGRLVLADGLHYARQLGATHLIDAATLTGACRGRARHVNAGVFANDEACYTQFASGAEACRRKNVAAAARCRIREMISSNIADIMNTGGRWGGADYGGDVPEGVRRRHAVDASRYRRHGVDGRQQVVDRQRAVRELRCALIELAREVSEWRWREEGNTSRARASELGSRTVTRSQ